MTPRPTALPRVVLAAALCCGCSGGTAPPPPPPSPAGGEVRALAHPANDPGTKLLQEVHGDDVVEANAELALGGLLGKSEETGRLLDEVRRDADKLATLPPAESLARSTDLAALLSRPQVSEVTLKMSKAGSEKLDHLKAVLGEPEQGEKGTVRLPVTDPETGESQHVELPVVWHHWSWASVAVYDDRKITAVRLNAEQWRKAAR